MIRRLTIPVPADDGHRVRLLAVSDETEPALSEYLDRDALGPLDLIVSCGDLEPDYISYIEGMLRAPVVYVTGNHDVDETWRRQASRFLPDRNAHAELTRAAGLGIALLDWPGPDKARTRALERTAWRYAISVWLATLLRRKRPDLVVTHVAPHDSGDPRDVYHQTFAAYRWLVGRLKPPLWLHGHTTAASDPDRVTRIGPTTCVNVTGAYLIELVPARDGGARSAA